jgi:hypothetical protein
MSKIIFMLLIAALCLSCGGGSNSSQGSGTPEPSSSGSKEEAPEEKGFISEKLDHKIFTDEAEVKRVVGEVFAKAGDNMGKLDKIDIWITRPSKEGTLKRDEPDYVNITLIYLNPDDPNKLLEYDYSSDEGKWSEGQVRSVSLISGNAETFVLANEMYDASALTSDMVAQVVKEAWDKHKDEAKYSDQWVKSILIQKGQIDVGVRGILSANDLEKTVYYKKKIK